MPYNSVNAELKNSLSQKFKNSIKSETSVTFIDFHL